MTDFYTPQSFFNHAALLRQAFAHCAKFPTAASRRSLGRISVPMLLIVHSNQLLNIAFVSHYLTNKLIRRRPIQKRKPKPPLIQSLMKLDIIRYYPRFRGVIPNFRAGCLRVTNPFASLLVPEGLFSLDLHVLSTPPAFVLSQDQTLHCMFVWFYFFCHSKYYLTLTHILNFKKQKCS